MKRLKHWEFEKSSLESGMKAIEKAREVYERRLREVRDKLKFGSVPGSPSVNSEVAEERTMFELRHGGGPHSIQCCYSVNKFSQLGGMIMIVKLLAYRRTGLEVQNF